MTEGRDDGLRILADRMRACELNPPAAFRYVANADVETARSIERGVLFLMAFWSVYSYVSFRKLVETLNEQPDAGVELVVVDVDGLDATYARTEIVSFSGWRSGGNGETAWIRGGRVIATTYGFPVNAAVYARNLAALKSEA